MQPGDAAYMHLNAVVICSIVCKMPILWQSVDHKWNSES